jgi:hypothetical protein
VNNSSGVFPVGSMSSLSRTNVARRSACVADFRSKSLMALTVSMFVPRASA